MENKFHTIVISRTDSLGDVMLTLPMCGILKEAIPGCNILFLGKGYTRSVIEACEHVDRFIDWDHIKAMPKAERSHCFRQLKADVILHVFPDKAIALLAQQAEIRVRIGTSHRLYHLFTCNKLVSFTRRNSILHESQLNLKLLQPLGIIKKFSTAELNAFTGFTRIKPLASRHRQLLQTDKMNIILHPRSKGSAREWGLDNFSKLIGILPEEKFNIFISGTNEDGLSMKEFLEANKKAHSICGLLTLEEFISFISTADGLVAASTGPLHIASALGKKAIGIYCPMQPIHPGRWAPIGIHAEFVVKDSNCSDCRKTLDCHCIREIAPETIANLLMKE